MSSPRLTAGGGHQDSLAEGFWGRFGENMGRAARVVIVRGPAHAVTVLPSLAAPHHPPDSSVMSHETHQPHRCSRNMSLVAQRHRRVLTAYRADVRAPKTQEPPSTRQTEREAVRGPAAVAGRAVTAFLVTHLPTLNYPERSVWELWNRERERPGASSRWLIGPTDGHPSLAASKVGRRPAISSNPST
jgi:hypothetical protein